MSGVTNIDGSTYNAPETTAETTDVRMSGSQFSGGGGGRGPMEPTVSLREYVDKADEAIETRLGAKLDGVLARLDALPSSQSLDDNRKSLIHNIWGTGVALLAAVLAILAFAGDRFDGGMGVSPILSEVQDRQGLVDQRQDAQLGLMDDKLDILIEQTADQ